MAPSCPRTAFRLLNSILLFVSIAHVGALPNQHHVQELAYKRDPVAQSLNNEPQAIAGSQIPGNTGIGPHNVPVTLNNSDDNSGIFSNIGNWIGAFLKGLFRGANVPEPSGLSGPQIVTVFVTAPASPSASLGASVSAGASASVTAALLVSPLNPLVSSWTGTKTVLVTVSSLPFSIPATGVTSLPSSLVPVDTIPPVSISSISLSSVSVSSVGVSTPSVSFVPIPTGFVASGAVPLISLASASVPAVTNLTVPPTSQPMMSILPVVVPGEHLTDNVTVSPTAQPMMSILPVVVPGEHLTDNVTNGTSSTIQPIMSILPVVVPGEHLTDNVTIPTETVDFPVPSVPVVTIPISAPTTLVNTTATFPNVTTTPTVAVVPASLLDGGNVTSDLPTAAMPTIDLPDMNFTAPPSGIMTALATGSLPKPIIIGPIVNFTAPPTGSLPIPTVLLDVGNRTGSFPTGTMPTIVLPNMNFTAAPSAGFLTALFNGSLPTPVISLGAAPTTEGLFDLSPPQLTASVLASVDVQVGPISIEAPDLNFTIPFPTDAPTPVLSLPITIAISTAVVGGDSAALPPLSVTRPLILTNPLRPTALSAPNATDLLEDTSTTTINATLSRTLTITVFPTPASDIVLATGDPATLPPLNTTDVLSLEVLPTASFAPTDDLSLPDAIATDLPTFELDPNVTDVIPTVVPTPSSSSDPIPILIPLPISNPPFLNATSASDRVLNVSALNRLRNLCDDPKTHTVTLPIIDRFFGPNAYPSLRPFPGCTAPNPSQAIRAPGLLNCTILGEEVQRCQRNGRRVLITVKADAPSVVGGNLNYGRAASSGARITLPLPKFGDPAAPQWPDTNFTSTRGPNAVPNLFDATHHATSFGLTLFSLFGEGHTERADLRPLGPDPTDRAASFINWFGKPLGEEVVVDGFDVRVPSAWKSHYQEGQFQALMSRLRELTDAAWTESGAKKGGYLDLGASGKGVVTFGWV